MSENNLYVTIEMMAMTIMACNNENDDTKE